MHEIVRQGLRRDAHRLRMAVPWRHGLQNRVNVHPIHMDTQAVVEIRPEVLKPYWGGQDQPRMFHEG